MVHRPVPVRDLDTAPYWEAAKDHRLTLKRCQSCGRFVHPPGPGCPHCGGVDLSWVDVGDDIRGTVYSYTIVYRNVMPEFNVDVPYVVALVQVADIPGVKITANLVNADPASVSIGMRVRMIWEDIAGDVSLPQWEPDSRVMAAGSPA